MVPRDEQAGLYLKFKVLDQRVLLPIESVRVALAMPQIQSMPNTSRAFAGVLNFHGTSISVYDLAQLLNSSESLEIGIDSPLLICKIEEQSIGFVISEMDDLVEVAADLLQPKLDGMLPFVMSIYKEGSDSWWVLSLEALVEQNQLLQSTQEEL